MARTSTKQLRAKEREISAKAHKRVDAINDNATPEEVARIEREVDALLGQRARLTDELDRRVDEVLDHAEARAEAERIARRPMANGSAPLIDEPTDPDYRAAFHSFIRARGDLAELSPEDRALVAAHEVRAQTTSNTAGGYTVPTELANFIQESMLASGPMYNPGVTSELRTDGGNPFKIPTVDDTAVTAEAHTEATALTDDGGKDVTFGQKSLGAFAYDTEFVRISMELAQDSGFAVERVVGALLGKRLGRIANSKLTTGAGTTEPWGIVTRSTLGVTATAVAAITFDELIDLVHSVDPDYRGSPKTRFMFNDTTLKAIRKLKDGDGQYLWSAGDATRGIPPTLLGYPYSVNQAMASPATGNKTVLFGDFGSYFVRKVGDPLVGVLRERFWPDLGMAGIIRFDGELADTAAV